MFSLERVVFNTHIDSARLPKFIRNAWKVGDLGIPGFGQQMHAIELLEAIVDIGSRQPNDCISAIHMEAKSNDDGFTFEPTYGDEPSVPINALFGCSRIFLYAWADDCCTMHPPYMRYTFVFENEELLASHSKISNDREWIDFMQERISGYVTETHTTHPIEGGEVTFLGYWETV